MRRITLMIALIFTGLYLEAHEDRNVIPTEKNTIEKDVISNKEKSTFTITESIIPKDKSWITSVSFYSRDNNLGYLIIQSKNKTTIHQNVPKGIWTALKGAKSTNGYYNFYIKDKYSLAK